MTDARPLPELEGAVAAIVSIRRTSRQGFPAARLRRYRRSVARRPRRGIGGADAWEGAQAAWDVLRLMFAGARFLTCCHVAGGREPGTQRPGAGGSSASGLVAGIIVR